MSIPQSFIQQLLAKADVVGVVGRYVKLKKSGANFMGLCPFHDEKSPSFSVSPTRQFYHCFGCGKSGNAIGFLMEHAGLGFVDAVQDLARECALQVPDDDASLYEREQAAVQRQKQLTLHEVLARASLAFQNFLKASPQAVAYCKGRGVSGQIARQFGLGYAPDGGHSLASVFADYADPLLVESGLVVDRAAEGHDDARRYDRFRDRVMFPIRNVAGECIGFGGRVMGDGKPKYLNSPETAVFSKGRELYGLFEARAALHTHGFALVTEGYMDVVALAQLGFPNAVATLGTACTTDHIQKLFRFTDAVVFSFDGDKAGRSAARKALDVVLPFATDMRSVKFLFLPPEHDPDSFIRTHGQEAFARCIGDAVPLSSFMQDAARAGCDLHIPEGRSRLVTQAQTLWTPLPEGAFKQQMLAAIAELTQFDTRTLQQMWHEKSLHNASGSSRRKAFQSDSQPLHATGYAHHSRHRPACRADHAARIVLDNMATLEHLSDEDHTLLCSLDAPYGPLFSWLEAQMHEHGPQPWVALQAGLQGHESADLAMQLMSGYALGVSSDPLESLTELRDLLKRMLIDQIKQEENSAIAQVMSDPTVLPRYRELQTRRLQLEATL